MYRHGVVSRAEHRRVTLLTLCEAAVSLYEENSPADVTVEAVAGAAGVSRRTVFRYCDVKEDLVFVYPLLWLDIFEAAAAEASDMPFRARMFYCAQQISADIERDPSLLRRAMNVVMRHPELMRGYSGLYQRWIAAITTQALHSQSGAPDMFRARVIGSATMGVIDAAMFAWRAAPEGSSLIEFVEQGFALVGPTMDAV